MRATVAVVALLLAAGCMSTKLPAPLSPAERGVVDRARVPWVTVAVKSAEGSGQVITALRQSGLFAAVKPVELLGTSPDLVVEVGERCGDPNLGGWVPILAIASLGIIPSWARVELGYSLNFSRPGNPRRRVVVGCGPHSTVVMGWVALALDPLPGWTRDDPEKSPQFADRVALEVAARMPELVELLDAAP